MAEDEPDQSQPSLELPSLFKRGRKQAPASVDVESEPEPPAERPPRRSWSLPTIASRPATAERPPRRSWSLPTIAPLPAAVLTGAVAGLVTVGLVWSAMRGCSSLRGTSSCGDPGYLVLLAVFVVVVIAGRALLAALDVPDPGSTALLGMALVTLVALVWVVDIESPPGAAALAVVGAATFGLAQWVTSNFTDPGDRPR